MAEAEYATLSLEQFIAWIIDMSGATPGEQQTKVLAMGIQAWNRGDVICIYLADDDEWRLASYGSDAAYMGAVEYPNEPPAELPGDYTKVFRLRAVCAGWPREEPTR